MGEECEGSEGERASLRMKKVESVGEWRKLGLTGDSGMSWSGGGGCWIE